MLNVSDLLLKDAVLKCVVIEVVLFSVVAFKTLTFPRWCSDTRRCGGIFSDSIYYYTFSPASDREESWKVGKNWVKL